MWMYLPREKGNVDVLSWEKVMCMYCPREKGNVDVLSWKKVMWMCCPGGGNVNVLSEG